MILEQWIINWMKILKSLNFSFVRRFNIQIQLVKSIITHTRYRNSIKMFAINKIIVFFTFLLQIMWNNTKIPQNCKLKCKVIHFIPQLINLNPDKHQYNPSNMTYDYESNLNSNLNAFWYHIVFTNGYHTFQLNIFQITTMCSAY